MGMQTASRRTWAFGLAIATIVVVAGVSIYVLSRPPPIPLTVMDGSTTGIVYGHFENYTDYAKPLVFYYSATSAAHEDGGTASNLTLQLSASAVYNFRGVDLLLAARVHGRFSSDLNVLGLTLAFNETGSTTGASEAQNPIPNPDNVSSNPVMPRISGTGSASVSPVLSNETGGTPEYVFAWTMAIEAGESLNQDAFFGVRATVTGNFAPAVSVGIILQMLELPYGAAPPSGSSGALALTIATSADGADWVVTLTAVPSGFLNTTTELEVTNYTSMPFAAPVPLGALYTSPYHTTVAYLPATPGSSVVGAGDRLLLSVAAYPRGDFVDISTAGLIVLWGWLL